MASKAKPKAEGKKARLAPEELYTIAESVYNQLKGGDIPKVDMPLRTKANMEFSKKSGVWQLGKMKGVRSAKKLLGARMLLRTIHLIEFIDEMSRGAKTSTLREMYYISEGWDKGKFDNQGESDLLVEDLEAITHRLREDFRLRPEEAGASVIGNLQIEETNRRGERKRIHCADDVGDSGYNIPSNVEKEKLKIVKWDADFVMAIESGGMFDRLAENGFDEEYRCILVHLKGQPARSTRRLIKRLNEEAKLPVVTFCDCDPWSFRIYGSVAYGAIKTAYISDYLATPSAECLGVIPSDIVRYDLPTDNLNEEDVKALNAMKTDPRFDTVFWRTEIDTMLSLGKKAEQQSLAKYGLEFVSNTYLPQKLTEMGIARR